MPVYLTSEGLLTTVARDQRPQGEIGDRADLACDRRSRSNSLESERRNRNDFTLLFTKARKQHRPTRCSFAGKE